MLHTLLSRGKLWEIRRKVKRLTKVRTATQRTVNNKDYSKSFYDSFDPQGSYTGVNIYDKYEKPVQDADDL